MMRFVSIFYISQCNNGIISTDSQMDTLQKNLLQWTKLDKELKELNKQCAEILSKKKDFNPKWHNSVGTIGR